MEGHDLRLRVAERRDKVLRKQRHTALRVWQRLAEEHGARVSESAVRGFVAEANAEPGSVAMDVTVGQEHPPGADTEENAEAFRGRGRPAGVRLRRADGTRH